MCLVISNIRPPMLHRFEGRIGKKAVLTVKKQVELGDNFWHSKAMNFLFPLLKPNLKPLLKPSSQD